MSQRRRRVAEQAEQLAERAGQVEGRLGGAADGHRPRQARHPSAERACASAPPQRGQGRGLLAGRLVRRARPCDADAMKHLVTILLLAACGGGAPPPDEPAPVAETAEATPEGELPEGLRALVDKMPAWFDGLAAALEGATTCDEAAQRVRAFVAAPDGDLMIRLRDYPEVEQYRDEVTAHLPEDEVAPRIERMSRATARLDCGGHADLDAALDDAGLLKKVAPVSP